MTEDVLDNPVWGALTGPQQSLGKRFGLAARFDAEVSPFGALSGPPTPAHWDDMAALLGPDGQVALIVSDRGSLVVPDGWEVLMDLPGVQMVALPGGGVSLPAPGSSDDVVALGTGDVDEMLELIALSRPGPFHSRTVEFGGYVGVRRQGRLVAMAGQRLRPPGYTEISAVATHPDHRGEGLAGLLVRTVSAAIVSRGEVPFLHAAADNENAIRLYETLGFARSATPTFVVVRVPLRG